MRLIFRKSLEVKLLLKLLQQQQQQLPFVFRGELTSFDAMSLCERKRKKKTLCQAGVQSANGTCRCSNAVAPLGGQ